MFNFFLSTIVGLNSLGFTNLLAQTPVNTTVNTTTPISCIKVFGNNPVFFEENISVGRKFERAIWSLKASPNFYHTFTCNLENTNLRSFDGTFAIADTSTLPQAQVSFYLDGALAQTIEVSGGQVAAFSLDLTNHTDLAVEYRFAHGGSYNYLHALQWDFK